MKHLMAFYIRDQVIIKRTELATDFSSQFSISTQFKCQKTVLFQTIQFSISAV